MKKFFPILMIAVLSILALSACGTGASPAPATDTPAVLDAIVAEGHVTPAQDLRVSFAVRGTVSEILVKEGQTVSKGDVLVRLGDREQADAALAGARLELTSAQQAMDDFMRTAPLATAQAWEAYMQAQAVRAAAQREYEKLDLNQIDDDITDAEAEVQDRKSDLQDAQDEADKYKDLNKDNARRKDAEDALKTAQDDYNEAVRKLEEITRGRDEKKAALDAAQASENEAKRKYDMSKDGPDADKLALLEARLENAKSQVGAAQNTLDNYELKAPFSGVITDVNVTPGEYVGPEKYAIQIADFGTLYVETSDLTELEVVNVTEGQQVTVVPDALPDVSLSGVVDSISQYSRLQGGDVLYIVKIRLTDGDPRLRWGMTVEATFQK